MCEQADSVLLIVSAFDGAHSGLTVETLKKLLSVCPNRPLAILLKFAIRNLES